MGGAKRLRKEVHGRTTKGNEKESKGEGFLKGRASEKAMEAFYLTGQLKHKIGCRVKYM